MEHRPDDFHRQLVRVVAELSDAAGPGLGGVPFDCERCSRYSEHCSSELNSVHLSGVLPGRRAVGLARGKGEQE
jgi:hypothetical protein